MISLLLILISAGCTSQATKITIQQYQKSESFKQLAFNNSIRIANEQMLLNLEQYISLHPNDMSTIQAAVQATWNARNELEIAREQYLYGRALTMLSVGQYLYDQQGVLNAWFEGKATMVDTAAQAAQSADAATGVKTVKDLFPLTDTTTSTTRPTTQPVMTPLEFLLRNLQKPR